MDKAIACGMLLTVVMTALAFGAVEAWSKAIFELVVMGLILLWAIKAAVDKKLRVRVPEAALPIAAFVILGLVQSVSLGGGDAPVSSLSMDVEATRRAVVVLFFLFASFIITANFFATRERLRLLVHFLAVYGALFAVFALVQHFTWDGRFYWVRPTVWTTTFGPFANHNHFAGYMEMLVPLPVALIISRGVQKDVWPLYGFAAAIMGVSVAVSLSRGGMASMVAGLLFIAVVWPRLHRRKERRGLPGEAGKRATLRSGTGSSPVVMRIGAVAVVAVAITVGVLWVGTEGVINRVAQTVDEAKEIGAESHYWGREWIWRDTLSMIAANPILGVGLGAYETVYPKYSQGDGSLVINYAHNDYLQALADGGIIGGLIALWFIVAVFRSVARGLKSEDPFMAGLALGGGAGIFSMLVHSLFDFNLQIPSNALLFLFLSAVVSSIGAAGEGMRRVEYAETPGYGH